MVIADAQQFEKALSEYFIKKALQDTVDILDEQIMAFLHLKVSANWKRICNDYSFDTKRLISYGGRFYSSMKEHFRHDFRQAGNIGIFGIRYARSELEVGRDVSILRGLDIFRHIVKEGLEHRDNMNLLRSITTLFKAIQVESNTELKEQIFSFCESNLSLSHADKNDVYHAVLHYRDDSIFVDIYNALISCYNCVVGKFGGSTAERWDRTKRCGYFRSEAQNQALDMFEHTSCIGPNFS